MASWETSEATQLFDPGLMSAELLPYPSQVTRLLMQRAHRQGDRGRDGILAKFNEMYWVPGESKLAQTVKHNCQLCKLRQPKLLQQEMGQLPEARLEPPLPLHMSCSIFLDIMDMTHHRSLWH